ncbi:MAG: DUF4129 domain-containing protein [Bacteroidia bacterium]
MKHLFPVSVLLLGFSFLYAENTQPVLNADSTTVNIQDDDALLGAAEEADDEDDDSLSVTDKQYQQEPLKTDSFRRAAWLSLKKGIDYKEAEQKQRSVPHTSSSNWGSFPSLFAGPAIQFIFIGVILLLLAFLLWKILAGNLSNKKVKDDKIVVSIEDIDDISQVSESELNRLLREALARQDYKGAIRIYYVSILLILSEKELISWTREKTNREYLQELRLSPHFSPFGELTSLYEKVWYGDLELMLPTYQRIEPGFKSLSETLKSITRFE